MLIILNYVLFLTALSLAINLARKGTAYRSAAIHMFLFSFAALMGGLAHQIDHDRDAIAAFIANADAVLPNHLGFGSVQDTYVRVWLITLVATGATEYYFMHIFLHPVAVGLKKVWLLRTVQVTFGLFCLASMLTLDYAIVIAFHVVSHLIVGSFAIWLIKAKGLRIFRALLGLLAFNLAAGGIWALMGLDIIPSGPLQHNDWYHIALIVFVVLLHQMMTRGGLAARLQRIADGEALLKHSEHELSPVMVTQPSDA